MENTIFAETLDQWTAYHWFEFTTNYVIPIVGSIAIILGGVWTLYQYFIGRNREFNTDILHKVYSPLFQILVSNEYLRELNRDNRQDAKYGVRAIPFYRLLDHRNNGIDEVLEDRILLLAQDRESLEYAPRDLVVLLRAYVALNGLSEPNDYLPQKIALQMKLRRNIIVGYNRYRKKLGLRDVTVFRPMYSVWGNLFFFIGKVEADNGRRGMRGKQLY